MPTTNRKAPAKAWTVTIPDYVPHTMNVWRGRHWSARAKAKKYLAGFLKVYGHNAGVPKVGPGDRVRRRVAFTLHGWPRGQCPDPDNFVKDLLDALKTAGLIVDDAAAWCEWSPPQIVRSRERKTVIEIGDLP